jgi:metal-responsive CopG/Arc/MetJ family transcriptional regulator
MRGRDMTEKKKLIGVYLPLSLITRIKTFAKQLYIKKHIEKSHSEIVEEAVEQYLDREEEN